ncbi:MULTISPECIES: hypothetical protein [Amycolatopsis]|uniref:Excreted virulence factor EspC, type VII ESX diderm n=2 Tax=Amycolatopsis TaxID=1813 RepID=A0A1I3MUQ5_9PSEU|nr:hypothetical protein [Amycolatopsis sacchari]SFJ00520.1 hypothetical protein SAMN05421835_102475 [Amycolatopsis sacchari]
MSDYEVVLSGMVEAGRAAQRVADVFRSLDFAGAVPDGDLGLPGARAVDRLAAVKRGWTGKEKPLVDGFTDYAGRLAQAVAFYRSHEEAAERELRRFEPPRGLN